MPALPPCVALFFCGDTEQVLEVMAAIDDLNFVEMAMLIDVFKVRITLVCMCI